MSWDTVCNSLCPIARSLAVVGDRWTLLILRELSLGAHRFDEIQAQTGMSSHLLATRLRRLEKDGVIEKRHYSERPLRHEYHATAKGEELSPVLMALQAWGLKWGGYEAFGLGGHAAAAAGPAPTARKGAPTKTAIAAKQAAAGTPAPTTVVPQSLIEAMRADREARLLAFQTSKSAARKG